jgi:hypothetical protein
LKALKHNHLNAEALQDFANLAANKNHDQASIVTSNQAYGFVKRHSQKTLCANDDARSKYELTYNRCFAHRPARNDISANNPFNRDAKPPRAPLAPTRKMTHEQTVNQTMKMLNQHTSVF